VKTYIEDIFQSISQKWKRTGHSVELKCEEDIEIRSYPVLFHQILTNLITNSLIHGFENIDNGKIVGEFLIEG
jgi:signal transduction histidine kinase